MVKECFESLTGSEFQKLLFGFEAVWANNGGGQSGEIISHYS
jgi:hypothetical protein